MIATLTTTARRLVEAEAVVSTYAYGGPTIREEAAELAATLLDGARDGSVNAETAAGAESFRAVTFTLSGGGPASDVTFILDGDGEDEGDVREAFATYYEGGRWATFRLDAEDAAAVYAALAYGGL